MTNTLIKLGLIGGGAYLAYNYWKNRKNNQVVVANGAGTNGDSKTSITPDALLDAEMEEEGEEGMAVAEFAAGNRNSRYDGWDSDTISNGL